MIEGAGEDTRATGVELRSTARVGTPALQLELVDFALKRPIRPMDHKPCSHGIVTDIQPFLIMALFRAQDVIEKSLLPIGWANLLAFEIASHDRLQSLNPLG